LNVTVLYCIALFMFHQLILILKKNYSTICNFVINFIANTISNIITSNIGCVLFYTIYNPVIITLFFIAINYLFAYYFTFYKID